MAERETRRYGRKKRKKTAAWRLDSLLLAASREACAGNAVNANTYLSNQGAVLPPLENIFIKSSCIDELLMVNFIVQCLHGLHNVIRVFRSMSGHQCAHKRLTHAIINEVSLSTLPLQAAGDGPCNAVFGVICAGEV